MKHLLKDPSLWREAAFVGGEWLAHTAHGAFAVRNPADGALLALLPSCKEAETQQAIKAAQAAFGPWRRTTAKHRGEVLRRWYELMLLHREDLATLITLEEGKPLAEARAEMDYASGFVRWFGEEATRVRGDMIPGAKDTQRIVALREPIGVCAAITP